LESDCIGERIGDSNNRLTDKFLLQPTNESERQRANPLGCQQQTLLGSVRDTAYRQRLPVLAKDH